jgi:hypothetical protein
MYSKPMVWKILSGLVLIAVLAGCGAAPTATATSTPAPTIDTKPTFDVVSTQAAQTVIANLTLTAPTATPVTPTSTPTMTNTPAPTGTPTLTPTETRVFIPWTKTPTPTQAAYSCVVTEVLPSSSDAQKVDENFDGVWTVKNTGTQTWASGNTDIRYISGTRFQKNTDTVDLNQDVAPNGTYKVTIDMIAPGSDGTYNTSWGIYLEDGSVCTLNLTINVSK